MSMIHIKIAKSNQLKKQLTIRELDSVSKAKKTYKTNLIKRRRKQYPPSL